jgi:hypothetical protein
MTLEEVIDLLCQRADAHSLTPMAIRRLVLLAYELGFEQGRREAHALE